MRIPLPHGDMEVQIEGSGRPLVLLHAFPFDHRLFTAVVPALAARHQVVTPDLRGFGGSAPGDPFSIADLADDLAALLDALHLDRAAVGGVSMGGYAALAFAARHAGRLDALVLADTKAAPDTPEAQNARDEAIASLDSDGVAPYVDKQLPKLLSPRATEAVRSRARAIAQQPAAAITAALRALRDRPDRRPELPAITCPTLIVVGADDTLTPPSEARSMQRAIPGAAFAELPGAGHLSCLETPEAFSTALLSFLAPFRE